MLTVACRTSCELAFTSLGLSAWTIERANSSSTTKTFRSSRSYVCDQRWYPSTALMSWAVIRTALPSRHTALEDAANSELLSDGPDTHVPSLEREGGGARNDVKPFHVGERVDHFLGDAVGEVFVILLPAHVHERQHGKRSRPRRTRPFRRALCASADEEMPGHAGRCGEQTDSDEDQRKSHPFEPRLPIWPDRGGPLDAARRHVERPGK